MYYAIDSFSGQKVFSNDSELPKVKKKYICPVCRAPVVLRKGYKRKPYFAHLSGKALPSCKLYNPGIMDDVSITYKQLEQRHHRSLEIYLKIVDEEAKEIDWYLEMGIPEPEGIEKKGSISFPFGWDGKRSVPIIAIKQGGLRLPIKIQTNYYQIEFEGVSRGNWLERISLPVKGLESTRINLFRYSPTGGKRVKADDPIYFGRSYVLLWKSGYGPKWWPHKNHLIVRKLRTKNLYEGAIISIYNEKSHHTESWLRQYIGRSVIQPPCDLKLVYPVPNLILNDGSYAIQHSKDIVIAITGDTRVQQQWKKINFFNWSNDKLQGINGDGKTPAFFNVELEEGRCDIWLDKNFDDGLHIVIGEIKPPRISKIPNIILDYKDDKERNKQVPLYSSEAKLLLENALYNNINEKALIGVNIPPNMKLEIKSKNSESDSWNPEIVLNNESGSSRNFDNEFLGLIKKLSNHKRILLESAVGRLVLVASRKNKKIVVPIHLRRRAQLLLKLSSYTISNLIVLNYFNKDIYYSNHFYELDKHVLQQLLNRKYWPQEFVPEVRKVLRNYVQLYNQFIKE